MVRVNIEQFVYGLQALSESGDIFSAKEETFIYPGSMGILDKGAIASLNSAVHSVEPDGSRISKDELQKLMTDHYFSGEENFFFALDYFARKKGTENLFSSDAREFLKESLGAGIKDRACDFYLRLHSLGVHVTLEQCMQILEQIGEKYRSYVGNDVLQDKGFWEFFATIILRYHLPFGVIGDAEHVYANVIRNNFFDESRLTPLFMEGVIAAYSRHHQILSSPEFISFILVVQDSYAGVRVIKDVDYYVELYQSPDRRNAVLKHASYARKVTKHIPVTGSLEIDDLKVLKEISENGNIKKMAALHGRIREEYALRPQVQLKELALLHKWVEDEDIQQQLFSEKAQSYLTAFGDAWKSLKEGQRVGEIPRALDEIEPFLAIVNVMPDDALLLARANAKIRPYNMEVAISLTSFLNRRADYIRRSSGDPKNLYSVEEYLAEQVFDTPAENEKVLTDIINGAKPLQKIARAYHRLYPKKETVFSIQQGREFAKLVDLSDSEKWVARSDFILEPNYGAREWAPFPLDPLVCLVEHPDKQVPTVRLLDAYPEFFMESGLGCGGILRSEWLYTFLRDDMYAKALHKMDAAVNWNELVRYVEHSQNAGAEYLDFILNPKFQQVAIRLFDTLDVHLPDEKKQYLRNAVSITELGRLFNDFPKQFKALSELPDTTLIMYASLVGEEGSLRFPIPAPTIDGVRYFPDHIWSLLAWAASENKELPDRVARLVDAIGWPLNQNTLNTMLLRGATEPALLMAAAEPAVLRLYEKLSSRDPHVKIPYTFQLPPILQSSGIVLDIEGTDLFNALYVLPKLVTNPELIAQMEVLKVPMGSWQELREIFENKKIQDAFRNHEFTGHWSRMRDGREDPTSEKTQSPTLGNFIDAAFITYQGVTTALVDRLTALGYKDAIYDSRVLVALKDHEKEIISAGFLTFLREIEKRVPTFPTGRLVDVPGLVALYQWSKKDRTLVNNLASKKFERLYETILSRFAVSKNGFTLLAAYQVYSSGVSWRKLEELMALTGLPPHPNHLYALTVIARVPELELLLKDRDILEEKISEYLEKYPEAVFRTGGIAYNKNGYDERPSTLNDYPTLFLVIAAMTYDALESKVLVNQIVDMIHKDVADTRTEYGGRTQYDVTAQTMALIYEHSLSLHDGSHVSFSDHSFKAALLTYHHHTVAGFESDDFDWSKYAAPSNPDLMATEYASLPGMTITGVGRNGDNYRVNFDLYLRHMPPRKMGDRNSPSDGVNSVLDLGVRVADK